MIISQLEVLIISFRAYSKATSARMCKYLFEAYWYWRLLVLMEEVSDLTGVASVPSGTVGVARILLFVIYGKYGEWLFYQIAILECRITYFQPWEDPSKRSNSAAENWELRLDALLRPSSLHQICTC